MADLRILRLTDVARKFQVHPQTIREWEKTGKLLAHRDSRGWRYYLEADLEKVMTAEERRDR